MAESKLLVGVKTELLIPENIEAFKSEVRRILTLRRANASGAAVDRAKRLQELETEIENLASAIAQGLLSQTIKARLESAEAERAQLASNRDEDHVAKVADLLPRLADTYEKLVGDLERIPARQVDRARADLKQWLGDVRLVPHDDGKHLRAEMTLEGERMLQATGMN